MKVGRLSSWLSQQAPIAAPYDSLTKHFLVGHDHLIAVTARVPLLSLSLITPDKDKVPSHDLLPQHSRSEGSSV